MTLLNSPKSIMKRKCFGAATVEMAFVAPAIFLIVFGSIEFSRMIMVKQSLTNAAREGCRTAVLLTTTSDQSVEKAVRKHLRGSIASYTNKDQVRIKIIPAAVSEQPTGTPIIVSVEVNFDDVSWLGPAFFDEVVLQANVTMIRE